MRPICHEKRHFPAAESLSLLIWNAISANCLSFYPTYCPDLLSVYLYNSNYICFCLNWIVLYLFESYFTKDFNFSIPVQFFYSGWVYWNILHLNLVWKNNFFNQADNVWHQLNQRTSITSDIVIKQVTAGALALHMQASGAFSFHMHCIFMCVFCICSNWIAM